MADTRCELCGLDCGRQPITQRFAGAERVFCCLGCVNVYVILSESGVIASGQDVRQTDLFKRSLELGLIAQGEKGGRLPEAPPEALTGAHVTEVLLHVSGMWCASCAWLIEHVVETLPGVAKAEVSFASDTVKVTYEPQRLPRERIISRIDDLGYHASPHSAEDEKVRIERRDLQLRTGLAFFLWLNIMTFSLAIYASYFEQISESVRRYLPFVLMALATPSVFYCAWPILRLAWRGLLNRVVRMETLLALGILAAYSYSAVLAFRGENHVYFDTASAIVAFVLAGKTIERGAKERSMRWLTALHSIMPNKARVLADGQERLVTLQALQVGQQFVVKAGERIPGDGVVVEGEAHVDESLLTGESSPVLKQPGSHAVAGSVNSDGVLRIEVTHLPGESTLAQIIQLVEKALTRRSDMERLADRVSRVFVPVVVLVALATYFVLWTTGMTSPGQSLMRAITILVIACPCALGLATPLAITTAMGTASQNGILVNDSRVLETLGKVDTIVFDKTGTITEGRFSLLDHHLSGGDGWNAALARLASLEAYSEHPLGRAVVEAADQHGIVRPGATDLAIHKGEGVTGTVEGVVVFIGNRRLTARLGASIDERSDELARGWTEEGKTVSFFGWSGELRGLAAFGDRVRVDAAKLVAELQSSGVKVQLLSGDSRATTSWVAARIGADSYRAECLPQEKIEAVRELQSSGSVVAMVGDGINDAPALAQADLGIAMGSGTDVAMKAAAVVLTHNSIPKIIDIFRLSRKTSRIVWQNLFWAFFYNVLGISLAITGILNPILAAGAMLLSSLSVIGNSLRLTDISKSGQRIPR